MLHILYTPIFNIINSYNNQKDNIWKNINYLKYFYHLFPTHVNKFYSLFHLNVNPKIEHLKGSIKVLEGDKSSIDSHMNYLIDTNERIKKLSKQITDNVTELNNKISSHDEFKSFVDTIKKELEKSIGDLKASDKTKEIDAILEEMVKKIKQNACECHSKIKQALTEHEEDAKGKICKYIKTINDRLSTQEKGIKQLMKKIERLVGEKDSSIQGKLKKMAERIGAFRRDFPNDCSYLLPGPISFEDVPKIRFLRPWQYDKVHITNIETTLKEIKDELVGYQEAVTKINEDLVKIDKQEVESYRGMIEDHVQKINRFNTIVMQNITYEKQLEKAKQDFSDRAELKKMAESQKKSLTPGFMNAVKMVTSVEHRELKRINKYIKAQKSVADNLHKQLNNTGFLLDYLDDFSKQKKILDEINLNENGLSEIGKLIGSMVKFRKTYKSATKDIIGSSSIFVSKFEKGHHDSDIRGGRSSFMPNTMRLDAGPIVKLEGHIKKLKAIQSFSDSLNGYSIGSLHLIEKPEGADIDALLGELKILNEILSDSGYIRYYVRKITEAYEENKLEINN